MIKYQVFVSSTYLDLKEERQAAVQAILRSHNIPAGMELFSAGNETQLKVIKEWIDDCDIYMLLLGPRYGSLEPESQLSYTEIEYRYAIEKGKPVFALIITDDFMESKLKAHGSSMIERQYEKYEKFKKEAMSRMCSRFSNLKDIELETIISLKDIIAKYDLRGWVKNTTSSKYVKLGENPAEVFSYGIKILKPKFGETLPNPVSISGTFKKELPEGLFYAIELNPKINTYWPKNEIAFDNTTKEWHSVMGMGQGDNTDRVMLIVAVGRYGKEIIDDFFLSPMHRGMVKLSDDMVIVDQVRIKLISE